MKQSFDVSLHLSLSVALPSFQPIVSRRQPTVSTSWLESGSGFTGSTIFSTASFSSVGRALEDLAVEQAQLPVVAGPHTELSGLRRRKSGTQVIAKLGHKDCIASVALRSINPAKPTSDDTYRSSS